VGGEISPFALSEGFPSSFFEPKCAGVFDGIVGSKSAFVAASTSLPPKPDSRRGILVPWMFLASTTSMRREHCFSMPSTDDQLLSLKFERTMKITAFCCLRNYLGIVLEENARLHLRCFVFACLRALFLWALFLRVCCLRCFC